jgi:hypothetical protein
MGERLHGLTVAHPIEFEVGKLSSKSNTRPSLSGAEAAPGGDIPPAAWNGFTLAVNVGDRALVDEAYGAAIASGARSGRCADRT